MKLVDVSIYGKQNYSLVETERDLEGFYSYVLLATIGEADDS